MGAEGPCTVDAKTWRLFIAFPLPPDWTEKIGRWQHESLGADERLRLVRGSSLHVTLVFLGAVPRVRMAAIETSMHKALTSAPRPTLTPAGMAGTRSVAMIELEDRHARAQRLQRRLSSELEAEQLVRPEGRPWKAHVTVARHRLRRRLEIDLAPPELPAWSPSEVALYHSGLHVRGAPYEIVQTLPIGGPSG